jgi:hypothetical protein
MQNQKLDILIAMCYSYIDMTNAQKLLKRLEWSDRKQGQGYGYMGSGNDGPIFPACPICNGAKPGTGAEKEFSSGIGHTVRCVLKKELEKV